MRYEDYKVEDMVFTTKENWTEDEMREFLNTCPECRDNEETIKALNNLSNAIRSGIVKVNMYGNINKTSAKAYARNHLHIYYGEQRYGEGSCLYVWLDGAKYTIRNTWTINDLLNYVEDVNRRFSYITDQYKKKEKTYITKKKNTEYTEENKSQILASRKALAWLNNMRLEVPSSIQVDDWYDSKLPEYRAETKNFYGSNYRWRNEYGELTFFDHPITEEEANHLSEVLAEASRKVSLIIDRCNVELQEMQEKYREMKGE